MDTHAEESRNDISVVNSNIVSIIESISQEEFDCAAVVVSSDDEFAEGVKEGFLNSRDYFLAEITISKLRNS